MCSSSYANNKREPSCGFKHVSYLLEWAAFGQEKWSTPSSPSSELTERERERRCDYVGRLVTEFDEAVHEDVCLSQELQVSR